MDDSVTFSLTHIGQSLQMLDTYYREEKLEINYSKLAKRSTTKVLVFTK